MILGNFNKIKNIYAEIRNTNKKIKNKISGYNSEIIRKKIS